MEDSPGQHSPYGSCTLLYCSCGNRTQDAFALALSPDYTFSNDVVTATVARIGGLAAPNDTATLLALKAAWRFGTFKVGYWYWSREIARLQPCAEDPAYEPFRRQIPANTDPPCLNGSGRETMPVTPGSWGCDQLFLFRH